MPDALAKMDAACARIDACAARLDAMEAECAAERIDARADGVTVPSEAWTGYRGDAATAETARRWKIRGKTSTGNKLEFSVSAFSHAEAKKLAEANARGGQIHDIVLQESNRR